MLDLCRAIILLEQLWGKKRCWDWSGVCESESRSWFRGSANLIEQSLVYGSRGDWAGLGRIRVEIGETLFLFLVG